jgi:Spy/CpxP family protein refolding chaperone
MRMRFGGAKLAGCLLGVTLLAAGPAWAQRGSMGPAGGGKGPAGAGGQMGGQMGGGFPGRRTDGGSVIDRGNQQPRLPRPGAQQQGPQRAGMGGLQMGPAGRWWDDRHYVRSLNLRPEQQKRMDAVFDNNRAQLQQSLTQLKQEQMKLAAMEQSPATDEAAVFAQIDRVSAARTALEKADAHVRLELRKEMDADQVTQLEREP